MKYTIRKYIDWGPEHADEFPSGWAFLTSNNKWDSSWSMKLRDAMVFDSRDDALTYKIKYSGILGENNSQFVEVIGVSDMEYFIAILAGR